MKSFLALTCTGILTSVFFCCAAAQRQHDHPGVDLGKLRRAMVVLTPTGGNTATGEVRFEQKGSVVTVTANLTGLEPNSVHAWHVHEWGDISAANGTATGGHYNPEGHPHALPFSPVRHGGDFGNITADGDGHARAVIIVDNITIAGTRNPIIGRGLIIHAMPDDGGQPTGNAGARIAQGVIGVAKPR